MEGRNLGLGDVGGNLDHSNHSAAADNGIIRGLDPDVSSSLRNASKLSVLRLSRGQVSPELLVFRSFDFPLLD